MPTIADQRSLIRNAIVALQVIRKSVTSIHASRNIDSVSDLLETVNLNLHNIEATGHVGPLNAGEDHVPSSTGESECIEY